MARKHSRDGLPAFGVSDPGDAAATRAMFAAWNRAGVPRAQQASIVKWWNDSISHKRLDLSSDDDMRAIATDFSNRFGRDTWDKTAPILDVAFEHGFDAIPAAPETSFEDDEGRAAELQRLMGEKRDEYANDPFLQQEALDLEQRRAEREKTEQKETADAVVGITRDQYGGQGITDRMAAYEKMMRETPGEYYQGPFAKAHQAEFARLVEASMQPFELGKTDSGVVIHGVVGGDAAGSSNDGGGDAGGDVGGNDGGNDAS